MSRLKRRLLIATSLLVLLALALGVPLQRTTRQALERAEAFRFRRMLVTRVAERHVVAGSAAVGARW